MVKAAAIVFLSVIAIGPSFNGCKDLSRSLGNIVYPPVRDMRHSMVLAPQKVRTVAPDSLSVPTVGREFMRDRTAFEAQVREAFPSDEASVTRGAGGRVRGSNAGRPSRSRVEFAGYACPAHVPPTRPPAPRSASSPLSRTAPSPFGIGSSSQGGLYVDVALSRSAFDARGCVARSPKSIPRGSHHSRPTRSED